MKTRKQVDFSSQSHPFSLSLGWVATPSLKLVISYFCLIPKGPMNPFF